MAFSAEIQIGSTEIQIGNLTSETEHAMRMFAQWELGDPAWANMFINLAEATDPMRAVKDLLFRSEHMDDETFAEVLADTEEL